MLVLAMLLNALVQFLMYNFAGLSLNSCIFGFLVGSIFAAIADIKLENN